MGTQTDIIKFEEHSIYASGYGFAPKFVMQDTELSIAAKAVYLYFCSLTGGSYSVYPTRQRILADLRIGKDKYYDAIKKLTEQNYLHISKEKSEANKFEHNIYHLNLNPKQYVIDDKVTGDMLIVQGLLSGGSGMLGYSIMKSRVISCIEKVIYGYIISFMGSGNTQMPAREEILAHLGISEKTYKRAIAKLTALELVKYSHARDKFGRVKGARYEVILTPSTWTSVSHKGKENVPSKKIDVSGDDQVSEPWGQIGDRQTEPWGQTGDTQTRPWGQIGNTQTEPWGQAGDTQTGPWGQTGDTQTEPWGQTGDTQIEPWGQIGDMQSESTGSKQGHYHKDINLSSITPTTTTDINELLIQIITSTTSEDVVDVIEDYMKSSMDKACLSDQERMAIEFISEIFISKSGVRSRGADRSYEYLERKTIKAIEDGNFIKCISRIVESYEQSEEPISYPQGWIQSVYARTIGTTQWDITPRIKKRHPKPKNAFHNFEQRNTDYSALVLEQVNFWMNEPGE